CDHPFTLNGVTGAASFSWPKRKLDAASGVTGWRLHDLRRTARSLLSRAGVNPDVAERCLGHAIPGVRGIYDRHRYIDEMRHAFEALAAQLDRIVHHPEGKGVEGRFRQSAGYEQEEQREPDWRCLRDRQEAKHRTRRMVIRQGTSKLV